MRFYALPWHASAVTCAHILQVDNDLTTPTFKLKRPQLAKHYEKDIEAMYKSINAKFAGKQ